MMRRHRMMISALLASTMIAGVAEAEEITAHPGDTIEVEYGGGGGGSSDSESEDNQGDYNEETGMAIQSAGSSGGGCDNMLAQAASAAAAGIGAIMSITGRATAPLQIAQQLQLVAQTICDTEQTRLSGDQLSEQRRMTARIGANAAVNVRRIERGAREAIGAFDPDLYTRGADVVMHDRYQSGLPEGWTFDGAADHTRIMREQTDLASREAAATAGRSNRAVNAALSVSNQALELSQGAEGQTAAIQAQTQMIRAQTGVLAAQHASDTANATATLRIEEERRASEVIADQKMDRFWARKADTAAPTRRAVFE